MNGLVTFVRLFSRLYGFYGWRTEATPNPLRSNDMTWKNSKRWMGWALGSLGAVGVLWPAAADEVTVGSGTYPAVASDGAGHSIVVWQASDGSSDGVFAQLYDGFAMPLGTEFRVNASTSGEQVKPDVVYLSTGDIVVVWQDGSGSLKKIRGLRLDDTAMPLGSEFQISSWGSASEPAVGADGDGNFVVAWAAASNRSASGHVPYARTFADDGSANGSEETFGDVAGDFAPAVGVLPSGDFLVVWVDDDDDVRGQELDGFAMPTGAEFQINAATTGTNAHPAAAVDSEGNTVVVWERVDGSTRQVIARQVGQGFAMPLGAEYQINTTGLSTALAADPDVAFDANGDAIVSWQRSGEDEAHSGIYARTMDSFAMPAGAEMQVASATLGFQHRSSIASDQSEGYVVVWQTDVSSPSSTSVTGTALDMSEDP
jgi:hypothetical protein